MATLNNPITPQNIVDRFADYVVATANAGISWGNNANPTYEPTVYGDEAIRDSLMGGSTSGLSIGISGGNIGSANNPITASTIYNALVAETNRYCRIRNVRARLNVSGGGGNTGVRPTAGIVFDQTAVAHLSPGIAALASGTRLETLSDTDFTDLTTGVSETISIGSAASYGLTAGSAISASGLETFFAALRTAYNNTSRNTTPIITRTICHASCHSSCHSSRGRR